MHVQPPCYFGVADAFVMETMDLSSLHTDGRFAALVEAFSLGRGDTLALSFKHQLPLKLRYGRDHVERQPAGRGRRVDIQVHDLECCTFGRDPALELDCIGRRAREPIELRDDELIGIADVVDRRFQLWPLGDARNLLGEDFLATRGLQITDLSLEAGFLLDGRGPSVPDKRDRIVLLRLNYKHYATTVAECLFLRNTFDRSKLGVR
jgi:hypothetical protein